MSMRRTAMAILILLTTLQIAISPAASAKGGGPECAHFLIAGLRGGKLLVTVSAPSCHGVNYNLRSSTPGHEFNTTFRGAGEQTFVLAAPGTLNESFYLEATSTAGARLFD